MSIFGLRAFIQSKKNTMHLAELSQQVGTEELTTTAQNISGAINEIKNIEAAAAGIDDAQISSVLTWSSDKISSENNKVTLENLVVNGNFADGLTGWTTSNGGVANVEGNVCLLTGSSTSNVPVLTGGNGGQTIPNGHKIYVRCYQTPPTGCTSHWVSLRDSTAGITDIIKTIANPKIGVRTLISGIITLSKDSTYPRLQCSFRFPDKATANGKIGKIEELLLIDLTVAFGVGNEPVVEEMDELMTYFTGSWFDGTVKVAILPYTLNRMEKCAKLDPFVTEAYDKQIKTNRIAELTEQLNLANRNIQSMYAVKSGKPTSSQAITVKNVGKQKMILHLHKRANDGYDTKNDVYLENAENDFVDVRIKTDTGEMLPYHVAYKGNIDIIPDARLGIDHNAAIFTDSGKNMITAISGVVSKSTDNGVTWTALSSLDVANANVVSVTSDDVIFFSNGTSGLLYRSVSPYSSYTQVLDITTGGYTGCYLLDSNMVEHPDGELFVGSYQSERIIRIYKSVDAGLSWTLIYSLPDTYQHVHSLFIDSKSTPVTIYAGVDGGGGVLKSTDKGETWVDLKTLNPDMPQSTDRGVLYSSADGYRLLGGETAIVGGYSIIKTTDDENFTPVLGIGSSVFNIKELNGKLIASSNASNEFQNSSIYISEDDGETWVQTYTTQPLLTEDANGGYRYMAKDTYASTDYEQIIVGARSEVVSPLRIISGEDTYYAEIIVEVPETCTELTVESGYLCSNETLIVNDFEIANDKIISFGLNEGGRYIKESVSGKIFEGDFDYHTIGKHLSYNYPYITNPKDKFAIKLNSLADGIDVDISLSGLTAFTISFWGRLGYNTSFCIFSDIDGSNDYIELEGYRLRNNNTTFCLLGYPITPDAFAKFDIVVDVTNNTIKTYRNGIHDEDNSISVASLIASITALTSVKLFKVYSCSENDAIQHFEIVEGALSESDIYNGYHDRVSDNQH